MQRGGGGGGGGGHNNWLVISVLWLSLCVCFPVAPHLEALKAASPHITDREKAHIRAVMAYASGNIPGAVDEWMSILISHPRGW